jgi:phosphotriesterase-related protein
MTRDNPCSRSVRRRDVLRWLGAGAVGGLFVPPTSLAAPFLQSPRVRRITFPRGAVIRTVLKDLAPDTIGGPTLFHEHMSLSRAYWDRMLAGMTPEARQRLGVPSGETYFLEDLDLIVGEMRAAREDGVACLVDGGHADMGRSVAFLKDVSTRSGMPIVVSGGYYTQPFHPADLAGMTDDDLAGRLAREAASERWGAYGEIASSAEMTDGERKVFRAIGKAHVRNGLPIFTHNTGAKHAVDQLDMLTSVGVKPEKIAIGHLGDINDPRAEVHQVICKRGAYVGFDRGIGERQARMIKVLADAGHRDRVLMSSDFAIARDTKAKGGPGYAKTMTLGKPELQKAGVDEETVREILVDNPRRFLAFAPKTS